MRKFKFESKASTSGYKKIETNVLNFGFPNVNLIPVYHKGKWYVPTGYVCYTEIVESEKE